MTLSDLENARVPVPNLFAYGIDADCHKVDTEASGFSYVSGIPSSYSSLTGKKVCRADMNGLGRSITQSKWFNQLGGYYTFSREVSDMIGGYPQGAILYHKESDTGYVRPVRSLIEDNTFDFEENPDYINNIYWSYVDNVPPSGFRPRIYPSFPPIQGTLSVDKEIMVDKPCLFMIQTGCDILDCTGDGTEYFLYATVKMNGQTEFHTASIICYLPPEPYVITQGVTSLQNSWLMNPVNNSVFQAWNCPSPIQFYLQAGDTVRLTANLDFAPMKSEEYKYWIFPLVA